MKKEFINLLLILGFILPNHAQTGGVVSFDVPAKNSLKFNKFLINPTFSFVREDESFVSMYNKRQFSGLENAPQAYFASYSGKFREDNAIGFGLFQRNYGVLTTFGIVGNFARNVELSNNSNFTFGLNLAYINSGLNTGKIVTGEAEPLLQTVPKNSLVTINPGLNYSTGFIDFGIAANNIFTYNFSGSDLVSDDPAKSFVGHVMYTGYLYNNSGLFENGKFSMIVKGEAAKEKTIFSTNLLLNAPKAGWVQAGYNSLYGISAGIGFTVAKKLSIGYTLEKGIGNLSNLGLSHEITLAYKLKGYGDFEDYKPIVKATKKTNPGTKNATVNKKTPADLQKERAEALALKTEKDKARAEAEKVRKAKELADAKEKAEVLAALRKAQADKLLALQGKDKAVLEAERQRKLKEAADSRANNANAARLKAEQDKANALAESQRLRNEKAAADAKAKTDAQRLRTEKAIADAKALADAKSQARTNAAKALADAANAKAEAERLRKEKADADAKALSDAKAQAKAESDKLKANQAEAERLRKEKADADAKALADAKAQAKSEADKLKANQAEAERLRKEKAEAEAKALADAKVQAKAEADKLKANQAEAERLRKEKADADAKALADAKVQAKAEADKLKANQAEAERLRKEKADADAKALSDAKAQAKAESDKLKANQAEAERLRKEKADADAKALADAKAQAKSEADKLKANQAEAERLRKEKADADAKALTDAKAQAKSEADKLKANQAEAERLRKEKAEADAKALADETTERLRKEADAKAKIDEAKTTEDKELDNLSQVLEDSKKNQKQSLSRLDSITKAKDNELKELRRVNDLSDKGIVSEAKDFQNTSAANRALESLKSEIAESSKNQNNFIKEFETLTNERLKKVPNRNDIVNQSNLKSLEKLKLDKLNSDKQNADLLTKLETIKAETVIEKSRRIKRAQFDSDDAKYQKDRETLKEIKTSTAPTGQTYKPTDFDFGEEQAGTQIIKNNDNIPEGYYIVIAIHKDVAKRDAFVKKAIQAGQKDIDFFYNASNGNYYIYYDRQNQIQEATTAMESKGSKPYNGKMVIVKVEK
ncbi:PorP/SprF family type IX secretion system membrane protein [Flavobacterium psychrophilum]|uniref:PorP/SprF family type IX secretion system membrane protein n=2 Tax=Flavobacterium psychrophilum TaxID=96345 RepID=UPI001D084DF9|nr:PorP/SprF family type IX secretion system membrane protein [Flavobacterium psychrophilum]MCB5994057.1 PorP/SprF family type IX secretion system membrane protein [Flavobacterium psychrophilum]MCB6100706.1 PorP/SprF family type IX secretion system membrane protein [Flavobacterium psychrophilum]